MIADWPNRFVLGNLNTVHTRIRICKIMYYTYTLLSVQYSILVCSFVYSVHTYVTSGGGVVAPEDRVMGTRIAHVVGVPRDARPLGSAGASDAIAPRPPDLLSCERGLTRLLTPDRVAPTRTRRRSVAAAARQ